jgi:hypothetical protein
MKAVNIAYWVSTVIIAGMMIFSGVTNAIVNPDSVKLIAQTMGYPQYIIGFLGVAKICGGIVILIPAFPRLKEWAYAGLFFDLLGATYSFVRLGAGFTDVLFMAAFIVVLFVSYFFHVKRLKAGKP